MAAEIVANCPRCGSQKITFDVLAAHIIGQEHGWQHWYETFARCRHCRRATIFILSESVNGDYNLVHKQELLNVPGALNRYVDVERFVTLRDMATVQPPDHVPESIAAVFREGSTCMAVGCNNAAGTMFRLCIDIATTELLPKEQVDGLSDHIRRTLGLRVSWLLDQGRLPESLRELSTCVREDGNDGAHVGTLKAEDAADLLDFTTALLERLYTEPERLKLAKLRRDERRAGKKIA
jgi:hypothetical protein